MKKPTLLAFTLGFSVCLHAGLILFLSVKASNSVALPAQNDREEAFSLVNIMAPPSEAPSPPPATARPSVPLPVDAIPATARPSVPPPVDAVPVTEHEPAELYIEAEEVAEEQPENEVGADPAPALVESAGVAEAVETAGRNREKSAQSAEYVKRNYRYIQRRIRDRLVYPAPARKAGIQGVAEVSFTIHEDGRVSAVTVLKSSGHGILDEAAVETIHAASPFPKPPAPARIAIPIAFRLR